MMRNKIWLRVLICLFAINMLFCGESFAQGKAPIPQQLTTAKKIFVSNAGADSGLFPEPFSGTPDRGYSQLYAAVQALGRYQLVDSPSSADLVLELRLYAPNGPANANKQKGASDPPADVSAGDLRRKDALYAVGLDPIDRSGRSAKDTRRQLRRRHCSHC